MPHLHSGVVETTGPDLSEPLPKEANLCPFSCCGTEGQMSLCFSHFPQLGVFLPKVSTSLLSSLPSDAAQMPGCLSFLWFSAQGSLCGWQSLYHWVHSISLCQRNCAWPPCLEHPPPRSIALPLLCLTQLGCWNPDWRL